MVRPLPAATLSMSNFTYAHSPGSKIPAAVPPFTVEKMTTPSHMSPPYPDLHSHTPTRDATLMAPTAEPSDGLHSPLAGALQPARHRGGSGGSTPGFPGNATVTSTSYLASCWMYTLLLNTAM